MAKSRKSEPQVSYAFPQLHSAVANAVRPEIKNAWFNKSGKGDSTNEYSTNVMGKFLCVNTGCAKKGWSSKKVAIHIKGYGGNGYHAVVFNQRCKSCRELGALTLDQDSYV